MSEGKADLKHLRCFYFEPFVLSISVLLLTLCEIISTNLTDVLLINILGSVAHLFSFHRMPTFYIITVMVNA